MNWRGIAAAVAWSVVVWAALWGDLSPASLVGGLLVAGLSLWLVPLGTAGYRDRGMTIHPVWAVRFLGYFVWSLAKASLIVAWEIVTPRHLTSQGIIAMPLRTTSTGLATLIANAISLTPGTVTLEIARDPMTLYIHVLHLRELQVVRDELVELEELALRAFDRGALDQEKTP